jgi:hypothetical protein
MLEYPFDRAAVRIIRLPAFGRGLRMSGDGKRGLRVAEMGRQTVAAAEKVNGNEIGGRC